jgi:IS5 family transposase
MSDWELMRQGLELEPPLQAIGDFLDDHGELVAKIGGDLRRGLKNPNTGRNGLTPNEVLRSVVLMRVKNWHYRELRERIADGYTLRLFTGFLCQPVPRHNAFHRAFVRLTPATLRRVNDPVVKAAVDLGLEDGAKLRVDTTVVETDIHHPIDNTLLWDVVRVLTRLLRRLGKLLGRRIAGFCNRTRAARQRMQAIQRMSARQRQWQQTSKYRELIGIARQVVTCAPLALVNPDNAHGKDLFCDLAIAGLHNDIGHYCGLADQVIDQARRRVVEGEQVDTSKNLA